MKTTSIILLTFIFFCGCNKISKKDENHNNEKYFSIEKLEMLKKKCLKTGNAEAFGNLVDYYANTPSDYYELLPISIIMANKYNNDNARVTIFFQMIMLENEGKRDVNLFFKLNQEKKDFIVSFLIDGVKNKNPGCKSILMRIISKGYQLNDKYKKILTSSS